MDPPAKASSSWHKEYMRSSQDISHRGDKLWVSNRINLFIDQALFQLTRDTITFNKPSVITDEGGGQERATNADLSLTCL